MYKYQNHTFEDKSKLYKTFSLILLVKQCYYTYIHAMIYMHYCKSMRCVGSILTKFRICGRCKWLQVVEWTMKSFQWIWMGALRSYTLEYSSQYTSFIHTQCFWLLNIVRGSRTSPKATSCWSWQLFWCGSSPFWDAPEVGLGLNQTIRQYSHPSASAGDWFQDISSNNKISWCSSLSQ